MHEKKRLRVSRATHAAVRGVMSGRSAALIPGVTGAFSREAWLCFTFSSSSWFSLRSRENSWLMRW